MKTLMKALRAPLFLAVIAALLASCAPEIKLSDRDWGQVDADKDARLVSTDTTDKAPTIWWNSDNIYRDVDIEFPNDADVLRANNGNIVKEMKNFLTLASFTRGSGVNAPDVLGTGYDYTFVRREPDNSNKTIITVRLPDAYNVNTSGSLVAKVAAGKYTFAGGKKLGDANDTLAGHDYYDDYTTLQQIKVASGSDAGTWNFQAPYKNWRINIGLPSPDGDTVTYTKSVVSLNISDLSNYPSISISDYYTLYDGIMNSLNLTSKLSLEKFDGKNWVRDLSGTFAYVNASSLINAGTITLSYTPEEFVPYRVKIDGIRNLETPNMYYGVKQRIRVNTKFNENVQVTPARVRIDTTKPGRKLFPSGNIIDNITFESIGAGEKDLKLRLVFTPINVSGVDYYISNMDLNTFKQNFKVAIGVSGGDPIEVKLNETEFLNIQKVEYPRTSEVILTLNASYTHDYFDGKSLSILIAPGFKYTSDNIIFGNYNNWDWVIDGVRNFGYYQSLNIDHYADYDSETSRIISFNANGGTGHVYSIEIGEAPQTLPSSSGLTPPLTGMVFIGWATSPSGGSFYNTTTSYNYTAFAHYKTTLYAQWALTAPATTYTVTFDINGGSGSAPPAQSGIPSGYGIVLPLGTGLTKGDNVFYGWGSTAATTVSDSYYIGGASLSFITDNRTLYAVYGAAVPATPTGLTAESNNSYSVVLNWSAVTGVNTYKVYKLSNAGTYDYVTTVPTDNYIDYSVLPNTTYSYRVSAVNKFNDSPLTSAVSVTTRIATPRNLAVIEDFTTSTSISLQWDAVDGADSYTVEYDTAYDFSSSSTQLVTGGAHNATISGLTPDTSYYFRVTAKKGDYTTAPTDVVSASTLD